MSLKPYAVRNRSSNFSRMERMLVVRLCRDNPDIDAKEYDKYTLQRKYDAWKNIMALYREEIAKKDFNLPDRDIKQLQGCWKRIKDQVRRRKNVDLKTQNIIGEVNENYNYTSDGNKSYNARGGANESYTVVNNNYSTTVNGESFSVTKDLFENYESETESSADNSNCQNRITADKFPADSQQDQVSFNPLLRIKEEIIPPDDCESWKNNDNAISFINTSEAGQSSPSVQVQNVPTLQRFVIYF